MPKPLPDYTPPEIADEIQSLGLSGLTHYSMMKGMTRNRLVHLFGSERHPQLLTFFELSRFAGITLDEFIAVVKENRFNEWIERLLWSKQLANVAQLEREANLGRDSIRRRINGYEGWSSLLEYAEAAEKLGWSAEKLARWIFRKKIYTNAS